MNIPEESIDWLLQVGGPIQQIFAILVSRETERHSAFVIGNSDARRRYRAILNVILDPLTCFRRYHGTS